MKFLVRDAYHSEIPQIVKLAGEFFIESDFSRSGLTVDLVRYRKTIENYWRYPSVKSIIAISEEEENYGEVLGYVHVYAQQDYTVEVVGELYQFYVQPKARATGVSRALVEAAVKQFDEWGCARSYAECAPGLPDEKHLKTFSNLWAKFGYKQVGITLMREVQNGREITSTDSNSSGSASPGSGSGQHADAGDTSTGATRPH